MRCFPKHFFRFSRDGVNLLDAVVGVETDIPDALYAGLRDAGLLATPEEWLAANPPPPPKAQDPAAGSGEAIVGAAEESASPAIPAPAAPNKPQLDHDGDGRPGGSLPKAATAPAAAPSKAGAATSAAQKASGQAAQPARSGR